MKYITLSLLSLVALAGCRMDGESPAARMDRIYWLKEHRADSVRHIRDSLFSREQQLYSKFLRSMLDRMDSKGDDVVHRDLEATRAKGDKACASIDSIMKDNSIYNQ